MYDCCYFLSLCHLAHRQSSKAYCLMISLKLEVLHANQTLPWTQEFFIDFLYSICLSSFRALHTYNCIFTGSCWDSACYKPSFRDVKLRHKANKMRSRQSFSKSGLSCLSFQNTCKKCIYKACNTPLTLQHTKKDRCFYPLASDVISNYLKYLRP